MLILESGGVAVKIRPRPDGALSNPSVDLQVSGVSKKTGYVVCFIGKRPCGLSGPRKEAALITGTAHLTSDGISLEPSLRRVITQENGPEYVSRAALREPPRSGLVQHVQTLMLSPVCSINERVPASQ